MVAVEKEYGWFTPGAHKGQSLFGRTFASAKSKAQAHDEAAPIFKTYGADLGYTMRDFMAYQVERSVFGPIKFNLHDEAHVLAMAFDSERHVHFSEKAAHSSLSPNLFHVFRCRTGLPDQLKSSQEFLEGERSNDFPGVEVASGILFRRDLFVCATARTLRQYHLSITGVSPLDDIPLAFMGVKPTYENGVQVGFEPLPGSDEIMDALLDLRLSQKRRTGEIRQGFFRDLYDWRQIHVKRMRGQNGFTIQSNRAP